MQGKGGIKLEVKIESAVARLDNPDLSFDEALEKYRSRYKEVFGKELQILEIDQVNKTIILKL